MVDDEGNVKVLDFGLASKVRSTMTALSVDPANSSGTPNYLSPEQFKGRYPGPAADQYALGVLTYQMLAGHLPFDSDDFDVLRAAVTNEAPEAVEGVPDAVNRCLQKVLSKDPKKRYANCTAFAEALSGGGISSSLPQLSGRRFVPLLIAAVAVTAAVVFAVLFFSGKNARHAGDAPAAAPAPAEPEQKAAAPRPAPAPAEPEHAAAAPHSEDFDGTVRLPGGVELAMVKIKAGTFMMGSPAQEAGRGALDDDESEHVVTISKPFFIGKYEVSQKQWQAVMGYNPSYFKGDDRPVEKVSWLDAKEFCDKLNELHVGKLPRGYRFDLPTEAQWEYACRAGTGTSLNSGENMVIRGTDNSPNLDKVGWYGGNCGRGFDLDSGYDISGWEERQYPDVRGGSHPVGRKRPNAWGLYDMHGNVWEWCRGWYDKSYGGDATDPAGPASGWLRVYRGGSWVSDARLCRSASRDSNVPGIRDYYLGFRLALVPAEPEPVTGASRFAFRPRPGSRK